MDIFGTKVMVKETSLLGLTLLTWIAVCVPLPAAPTNVVLIMVDDLGYHDLGCYGHPRIRTPVIDQLAADGIRLTSFYAGATVCTPSRMALLTGCYPSRLGWTKGVVGHIMREGTGLDPKAVTMAEVFKANGYRTGMVGKWHLGDGPRFRPHRQGFDSTYYINKSNNQTDELWRDDQLLEKPFNNRLLTEKFTTEAIRFIKSNATQPFLLYLPYTAPHFPVEPHPDFKGTSKYGVYGDVVEELDFRIGQILATLDEEKLANDTIIVFLSDNGPEPLTKQSKATPFRGKKWSALEGGTRVPCIVRFRDVVPAGVQSDAIIAAIDLLPTLAAACEVDLSAVHDADQRMDGVNVWATLTGNAKGHARNDLLYWHGSDGFQAIRMGDWKLFVDGKAADLGQGDAPVLIDLSKDLDESTDVSQLHPDVVEQMKRLAARQLKQIRADANRLDP